MPAILVQSECRTCGGQIEFDKEAFEPKGEHSGYIWGQSVTCPLCGDQTALRFPAEDAIPPQIPLTLPADVFLDEGGIFVSKTRFIVGNQTFATANITSVRGVKIPPRRAASAFMILGGLICALIGGLGIAFLVVGVVLLLLGAISLFRMQPSYAIAITTAGGEVKAYETRSQKFAHAIVNALNTAIVARG